MSKADELQAAIRAKCLECSGGSKNQVKGCGIKDCPLWVYRTAETQARITRLKGQMSFESYLNGRREA